MPIVEVQPNLLLLSEIVHVKIRRKDIRVAIQRYHITGLPESQQIVTFRGLLKAMLGLNFAKGRHFTPLRLLNKNIPGGIEYETEPPYPTLDEDEEGVTYPDQEEILWLSTTLKISFSIL